MGLDLQMADMAGQLSRLPRVICVAKRHHIALCASNTRVPRSSKAAVFLVNHANPRVAAEARSNRGGCVCGAVIDHNDLKLRTGLPLQGKKSVSERFLGIESRNDN
jgi:hypothetical protein